MLTVCELLRIRQKRLRLRHRDIAAATGLGETTVQRALKGTSSARRSTLSAICRALHLPPGLLEIPTGTPAHTISDFQRDALCDSLDPHARIEEDALGRYEVVESCPGGRCALCVSGSAATADQSPIDARNSLADARSGADEGGAA